MPGVKLHRVSFYKGPVDSLEVPAGIKGATSAQGNFRTILSGSWPEGQGLHHLVSEHRKSSFLSVAEKRGEIL
jgi:hypothetical protein